MDQDSTVSNELAQGHLHTDFIADRRPLSASRCTGMQCLKLAARCTLGGSQYHRGGLSVELVFWIGFLGLESLQCWPAHRGHRGNHDGAQTTVVI